MVLSIFHSSSITGVSWSDVLMSYQENLLGGEVLPLCRDAVAGFCTPSWQSWQIFEQDNQSLIAFFGLHWLKRLLNKHPNLICPVGWGCRIHRLLLCRGVRRPSLNECPGYDIKKSEFEVPVLLELWEMRSIPSLPSLPGPLWAGVVAPDKGPIYGLNRTKPCFLYNTDFGI